VAEVHAVAAGVATVDDETTRVFCQRAAHCQVAGVKNRRAYAEPLADCLCYAIANRSQLD
jgi:hypothetical protein